jgi:hypothetical protein
MVTPHCVVSQAQGPSCQLTVWEFRGALSLTLRVNCVCSGSPRCRCLFTGEAKVLYPVRLSPTGADVRGVCCWWVWNFVSVVRFVCVVLRGPLCVRVSRVSRVCPGSPRCLFTGTPVSRLPPVFFYRYWGAVES